MLHKGPRMRWGRAGLGRDRALWSGEVSRALGQRMRSAPSGRPLLPVSAGLGAQLPLRPLAARGGVIVHSHRNGNRWGRGVFSEPGVGLDAGLPGWRTSSARNTEPPGAGQGCRCGSAPLALPLLPARSCWPPSAGPVPRPISRLQADPLRVHSGAPLR